MRKKFVVAQVFTHFELDRQTERKRHDVKIEAYYQNISMAPDNKWKCKKYGFTFFVSTFELSWQHWFCMDNSEFNMPILEGFYKADNLKRTSTSIWYWKLFFSRDGTGVIIFTPEYKQEKNFLIVSINYQVKFLKTPLNIASTKDITKPH